MSDLIDRQAAIDEFYKCPNWRWTTLDVMNRLRDLPSTQGNRMRTVFIECGYIMNAEDRAAMEAGIASKTGDDVQIVLLPYGAHVAEPKPEWIPTKERTPEKRGRYLVYMTGMLPNNITVSKISAALFWPGVWQEWTVDGGAVGNVVAWMPLPEPYTEDNT